MENLQVTKGCDPELFFIDDAGKYVSSIGKIGGSKDFPRDIGNGCAVQEDNVSVEFNTPPCKTADDFVKSIKYNLDYIQQEAQRLGLKLAIVPSAVFEADQLEHPAAQEFGCEPDYNAWNGGQMNPRPSADNGGLRSAGGHIHIEIKDGLDILEVVKAMDWFVGCQMITFDNDRDRRRLYGKPGSFRKKPYGVEYRTASNAWIQDEGTIRWVWEQTDKAVDWVRAGNKFTDEQGELIQKCINDSSVEILEQLSKELPL